MSNDLPVQSLNKLAYFLLFLIPSIFMFAIIFYLSSLSHISAPINFSNSDKIFHFTIFSILSYSIFRIFSFQNYKLGWVLCLTFLISTSYGVLDEIHQMFIPGRNFDYLDMLADSFGSLFGIFIGIKIYPLDYHLIQLINFKFLNS